MGFITSPWCFCITLLIILIGAVEASHKYFPELASLHTTSALSTSSESLTPPPSKSQPHRTGYHFQPSQHWINDPNGPFYFNGYYHLFYQYNPYGAVWGNIVWAHSVSKDLINWKGLEHAIKPSESFDKYGTWSGSTTILPGNKPAILYTGIVDNTTGNIQVQNIAFPEDLSDPYLRKWVKPAEYNPIIRASSDINATYFRDPTTAWYNNGHYHIIIGGLRRKGNRGMSYLYRSRDFIHWKKAKHPLHSSAGTGNWECPDFFPVDKSGKMMGIETSKLGPNLKFVLKNSLDKTRYDVYTIGSYDEKKDKYTPDEGSDDGWDGLRLDYGNFYASKTFFDYKTGRRILTGWANESDSTADDVQKGWAGIHTIPRKIWLDPSGKQLVQWPVKELESLRCKEVGMKNQDLVTGKRVEIKGITAAQADVEVVFTLPKSLDKAEPFNPKWTNAQDLCGLKGSTVRGGIGPFGLLTLATEDLQEYTPVFFRVFKAEKSYKVLLCSDARSSSLEEDNYTPSFAGFVDVDLSDSRELSLRSLIDHSVVESFGAGGKTVITSRVYPTKAILDKAHLYVFNNGSETITVKRLNAWNMNRATISMIEN